MPEAEFAAGFALARLGRTSEAEKRYRRALAMRPDFAAAWINLGSLLRDEGREAEAEAALRRAVELRPDLISGWVNLAAAGAGQENGRKPRRPICGEALALNPNQVETLVAWCQLRAAERDVAGAREWMRWALARNADFDEAVNMHGIVLHLERRFEEAVGVFERAEELGNRAAASNRGNSLLDLGRMEEALKAHERAVELDAVSAGAKYNLALTQLRMGDWTQRMGGIRGAMEVSRSAPQAARFYETKMERRGAGWTARAAACGTGTGRHDSVLPLCGAGGGARRHAGA